MLNGRDGAIAMIGTGDKQIDSLSFDISNGNSKEKKKVIPDGVCTTHSAFDRLFPTLHCYEGEY